MGEGIRRAWREGKFTIKFARPNQLEAHVAELLSPLGFHFVGKKSLRIAGQTPDFWDGDHKVIEVYGDYWHRNDDPQERIDLFKAHGYDCLVVWEREWREDVEAVVKRIVEFA